MSVAVIIPQVLRQYVNGQHVLKVTGNNVAKCLENLTTQFPGMKQKLYNEHGEIAHYFHLSVNGEKISAEKSVEDGDELQIFVAVAGG